MGLIDTHQGFTVHRTELYSYLVIIFNRKESEQENIYMHIYLNHFGVNLKYCISTIFQLKLKKKSDGLNDTLNKTIPLTFFY